MLDFSLCFPSSFTICLWQRTLKLQSFGSSCYSASHCFTMDSKELSSILDCFGDQITTKNTETYTIWLEMITKVLNMLIELKGNNYYSKVFKRVNYKLSNNTFWVVINAPRCTSNICILWQTNYENTSSKTSIRLNMRTWQCMGYGPMYTPTRSMNMDESDLGWAPKALWCMKNLGWMWSMSQTPMPNLFRWDKSYVYM